MLSPLVLLILPIGLALALASLIRLALGPERGARLAGAAVVLSFLISWGVVLKPGWMAVEPVSRVGHMAFGAMAVGIALDFFRPKRLWAAIAAGVVILVCTWASVNAGLWPPLSLSLLGGASIVVLAVVAFLMITRLDSMAREGISALVILVMLCLAIAAVAALAHDDGVAETALALALATVGYLIIAGVARLPTGDSVVLGGGVAVIAIAWALSQREPRTIIALLLVPLICMADGTAKRISLPKARISAILYPLLLAGIAGLPLVLAAIVAYTTAR